MGAKAHNKKDKYNLYFSRPPAIFTFIFDQRSKPINAWTLGNLANTHFSRAKITIRDMQKYKGLNLTYLIY